MFKIFIVVAHGGKYHDERWNANCIATFDKAKAEAYIDAKMQDDKRHNKLVIALEKFDNQYEEKNPLPKRQNLPKITKWTNLKDHEITAEMRAERVQIMSKIEALDDEHNKKTNTWKEAWIKARNEFCFSQGGEPIGKYESLEERNRSFRIEELEII